MFGLELALKMAGGRLCLGVFLIITILKFFDFIILPLFKCKFTILKGTLLDR